MPGKGINKVKARKVRQGLLQGLSYKDAMVNAGYTEWTGKCASKTSVLQTQLKSIEEEFKLSDITPQYVISKINCILNDPSTKKCDQLKATELLGKFLAIWRDRAEITTKTELEPTMTQEALDKELDAIIAKRQTTVVPEKVL